MHCITEQYKPESREHLTLRKNEQCSPLLKELVSRCYALHNMTGGTRREKVGCNVPRRATPLKELVSNPCVLM